MVRSIVLDDIRMPLELISLLSVIIIPLLILLLMKAIDLLIGWIITVTTRNKNLVTTTLSKYEIQSESGVEQHSAH